MLKIAEQMFLEGDLPVGLPGFPGAVSCCYALITILSFLQPAGKKMTWILKKIHFKKYWYIA
jgi:hypothetical protein